MSRTSALLLLLTSLLLPLSAKAQMDSDFSIGGAIRVGTSTTTCNAAATGGIRYTSLSGGAIQFCNGTSWQSVDSAAAATPDRGIQFNSNGSLGASSSLVFSSASRVGILTSAPAAPLHINGEAIIGPTTGISCGSTTTGGLRWSSANSTFEMCDGSSWKLLVATGGSGTPSSPNAGTGYFVLSNGTWNGALGGLAGANALCLSDLQSNNWLNKTDAAGRGLLNGAHVEAFLCTNTGGGCQNPLASTTYTFAASGNSSTGGATFTTNGSGQGPGNTQDWSGSNYFGGSSDFWSARSSGTSTLWDTTHTSNACQDWSDSGGAGWGSNYGSTNNTNESRWNIANSGCGASNKLVCMVHPGNESSMPPAYFVLTDSTWTGNLGDLAGADAKCLTELTTNTNWKGYTAANTAGQLVGSKVKAFICDGTSNEGGSSTCNNLMPNQTYSFAKVGDVNAGGASFTTDGAGQGPNDGSSWAGANHFSGSYTYWTVRDSAASSLWSVASEYYACANLGNGTGSYTGKTGISASTSDSRWDAANELCSSSYRLVCFVNP